MKKSFAEILTGLDEGTGKKVKKKIPAWEGAVIPSALSLEQCSSQAAAEYKCRLLKRFFPKGPNSVCDLTCGLGVDSLAFSKIAGKVTSFERSETLAYAARGNFLNFGAGNIEVRREEVGPATDFPAYSTPTLPAAMSQGTRCSGWKTVPRTSGRLFQPCLKNLPWCF